jgi:signal transduction histidine kinase
MAVELIDDKFIHETDIDGSFHNILQYGDMLMVAYLETDRMKVLACNHCFAKKFRISISEKTEIFLDNLLHDNGRKIQPIISFPIQKPITNIVYRHNDSSPLECYFYECDDGKSLLMYLQLQESSSLDLVEKMSAITTEMAGLTLELRKKNYELGITRDTMVYQARMAATSEIIQMLAHQWRQPLNVLSTIAGTMQLDNMMNALSKEGTADGLQKMNEVIKQLSLMIDEFRVLYETDTELKKIELFPLISKAVNLLTILLDETGVEVNIECASYMVCYSLEAELLQCLVAILKNSIEAFSEKVSQEPTINIIVLDEGQKVQIIIEDNAGGIAKNDLDNVFDPYFSTKSNTTKGLGLYIVKTMLTEKMAGEVILKNTQDGLRVSFTLPKTM